MSEPIIVGDLPDFGVIGRNIFHRQEILKSVSRHDLRRVTENIFQNPYQGAVLLILFSTSAVILPVSDETNLKHTERQNVETTL